MKAIRKLLSATYWVLMMLALSTCSEPEQPKPTITTITPNQGQVGSPVVISGENFSAIQSVQFGSVESSIISKSESEVLTVVPPGLIPGVLPVVVKTDGGTSNSIQFTVVPSEPEITSIEPNKGAVGMQVTINGKHFASTSSVSFGPTSVTTFISKTDTDIKLSIPEDLELGALNVTVTTDVGTSPEATFTVVGKPTISSISPLIGPVGKKVTITGTYFEETSDVFLGTVAATFQILSATVLEAVVPANAVTGKIKVIAAGGEALSPEDFVVKDAPILSDFFPTTGIVGTLVTINGINFDTDVVVQFGTVEAPDVTIVSSTQLTVKVPPTAATGKITIGTDAGSSTSEAVFTVIGAPVITSFSPNRGGQGADIIITGENFVDVANVKFNTTTVSAGNYTVISTTMISAKVPAGAETGKISVKTSAGTGTSTTNFTVLPKPTITSFTPTLGPAGRKVSIIGTNFQETSNVFFGTREAAFEIKSATLIEATVPAAATTGKVKVVTAGGEAISTVDFVVKDAPVITSFSPSSGVVGTIVTINGKSFDAGAVVVKFGSGTASAVTVVSATQLTVVVPNAATTGKITVTTAAGSVLSATDFTLIGAPKVTVFAPTSGGAGIDVVITGSDFVNVATVKFNNTVVAIANYSVISDTKINAKVPAGASSGKISVTTPAGTGASGNTFIVIPPPTITSFTPAVGPVGTIISVFGTNFSGATKVFVGAIEAAFSIISPTEIEATVPGSAVTGKIKVITAGGETISATDFVVKDAPQITSFTPPSGIVGAVITINGNGFDAGGVVVKFGTGTATDVTVVNATQITAKVPANAITGKITVTTAAGSVLSLTNFTVIGVPTVTSFAPTSGGTGMDVVITGTNFINVSAVKFNTTNVSAGNYSVVSPTQINAKVPAGAVTGKISVTTPAGSGVSTADFTVLFPPVVTSFSPGSGALGSSVVITGTGFASITAVSFNDVDVGAGSFTVNSLTQITASVPANATSGKIKVTNAVGTGVSANTFYVTPFISTITPAIGSAGTSITITGTNLAAAKVYFTSTEVTPSTNSNTVIMVDVPAISTGAKDVTVVNLGGTSNSKTFTVAEPVVLDEVIATQNIKGQLILLVGSNLQGATKVLFGSVEAPVLTSNYLAVTAIIPNSLSLGNYTVKAVTSNGTSNGQTFEVLSVQNPNTGGVTLTNGVSVVSLPPGYVPPISNFWVSTIDQTEGFSIQDIGEPEIEVIYQKNGEADVYGTNVIFDVNTNYIEFTISGIRYVGMYTPGDFVGEVDCFHYMTLISTESGMQLTLKVTTFNDGCPTE